MFQEWEWAAEVLDSLTGLLPKDPFREYISAISNSQGIGWLNWFVPVAAIQKVVSAWLLAIALYYIYMMIMRWIKLI